MTDGERALASEDRTAVTPPLAVSLLSGVTAVECDSAAMATWLGEMLGPAFDLSASGPADVSVVISSEPVRGPTPAARWTEPCFALDTQVQMLPASRAGSVLRIDHDEKMTAYFIGPRRVTIAPVGPSPDVRIAAFLALRELAVGLALATPRLQLHVSGFAADGAVALLTGAKGAGKTTTLAHLAASTGSSVVTNDRAIVSSGQGSWQVRGVPTIVGLRAGTRAGLPGLLEDVTERTVHLTSRELAGSAEPDRRVKPGHVPAMSLAQLARRVGSPLVAGGRPASLGVLRIDDSVGTFALRPMAVAEAERVLYDQRFGVVTEPRPPTVFELLLGRKDPPVFDRALLRRLVSDVPCIEVRMGHGLLKSEEAAQDLAAALLNPPRG
jgi:hypothetical protein